MTKLILSPEKTNTEIEVLEWTLELFHVNLILGIGEEIIPCQITHKLVEEWANKEGHLSFTIDPIDQYSNEVHHELPLDVYLDTEFDTDAAKSLAEYALESHLNSIKS